VKRDAQGGPERENANKERERDRQDATSRAVTLEISVAAECRTIAAKKRATRSKVVIRGHPQVSARIRRLLSRIQD
jgi:hypothetical protein